MKNVRAVCLFLLIALGWLGSASAQVYPTIPANSVLGRLGSGNPGQPQAIPLALFSANLWGVITGDCTISTLNVITCTKTNGAPFTYFATGTDASNLTGSAPLSVIGGSAASHAVAVDVAGVSTWKVIPNCVDSGGNHLNYTQSTDVWSCGTASVAAVTSVSPGNGLTSTLTATAPGSAITSTGTLSSAHPVNPQTGTSYAIADGDRAKLITATNAGAQGYTIAQAGAASAFQAGWYVDIQNNSTNPAGIVTITPTTSTCNLAGSAGSTCAIYPGASGRLSSDGTNYQLALNGVSPYIAGSFLPTITTDATVGTPAYTTQVGSYERIGRLVTLRVFIKLSGWTGSPTGNVFVGNLPYTSANVANDYGGCVVFDYAVAGLPSLSYGMNALIANNDNRATLITNNNTGVSTLSVAQVGSTAQILMVCNYHV